MKDILEALGRKPTVGQKLLIFVWLGAFVAGWLGLRVLETTCLRANPLVVQALCWELWFVWQGWLFGRNRERYLRADPEGAYRLAFARDIMPGVGFGICQMQIPWVVGLLSGPVALAPPVQLAVALVCGLTGVTLLTLGFGTIGFAAAGFLNEYRPVRRPMVRFSIYSVIRHPLFLGGVLASVGAGLLFDNPMAVGVALVNLAILPVYRFLEDRRQASIFGDDFRQYQAAVGAMLPRWRLIRSALVAVFGVAPKRPSLVGLTDRRARQRSSVGA